MNYDPDKPDVTPVYVAEKFTVDDTLKTNDRAMSNSISHIIKQVVTPRANLGGAGPPGRAD